MRSPALLALPAALVMLGGAGPPLSIERAFGNTIVSTYPDKRHAELWLHPGGSYDARGRHGEPSRGRWRVEGDRLCLKQDHPWAPPFFRYCTQIPSEETWTTKAVTGEILQVRLVRGCPTPPA
jgi:hypothetical protein